LSEIEAGITQGILAKLCSIDENNLNWNISWI